MPLSRALLLASLALALVASGHVAAALPVEEADHAAPGADATDDHAMPAPDGGSAEQAGDDHGDEDPEQHGSRDPEDPESSEYSDPEAPENDKIMQDLDKDHDGKISHQELLARLEWVRQKEIAMDGESGHGTEADTGRHWSTEAEVDQLMHDEQHKAWFSALDKDKDGSLTLEERLADLAGTFDSESAEDKKIMDEMKASESSDFKWADKDKNGKMTYREHIMGTSYPPGHDAGPQDAHNPDTDNDKHVSLSEHLKSVTSELAEDLTEEEITEHKSADEELTREETERFSKADKNMDGKLSAEEYKTIIAEDMAHGRHGDGERESTSQMTNHLMETYDQNKDGHISAEEMFFFQGGASAEGLGEADTEEAQPGPEHGQSLGWDTHPSHVMDHGHEEHEEHEEL